MWQLLLRHCCPGESGLCEREGYSDIVLLVCEYVQKIQSLENTSAEGSEDQEEIQQQLEKLYNERSCLPNNYG